MARRDHITGKSKSATFSRRRIFFRRRSRTPRAIARGRISRFRTAATIAARSASFLMCAAAAAARRRSSVVAQVRDAGGEISRSGAERDQPGPLGPRSGRDASRLADLVRRLLDETPIERLRLSSVEPMDFSDDLLRADGRIAAHRQACARAAAIGLGYGAAADASQVSARGITPIAS